jgi:hypothetical protein
MECDDALKLPIDDSIVIYRKKKKYIYIYIYIYKWIESMLTLLTEITARSVKTDIFNAHLLKKLESLLHPATDECEPQPTNREE